VKKNLAPLFSVLAFGGLLLALSWSQADLLRAWASKPNLLWGCAGILALVAAAILTVRSYPQVRQPRLYGFVLLLLPWALLQPLYFANVLERNKQAGSGGVALITVEHAGELERPSPAVTKARHFVGLPDTLAKQHPELPPRLREGAKVLFGLGYLWFALAVLLVTPLGRLQARRSVRLGVWALFGLQVTLGAVAWSQEVGPQDLPSWLVPLVYLLAVAVAIHQWRSAAGLGGAIAGLLLVSLPAAIAHTTLTPDALGLPIKPLPHGVERAFAIALPWLVLWVVGREWVVTMSHTTQHDALTQIFNKAYAETIVNRTGQTDLGRRYSVAILDIDLFKKVNDTYGHSAGDDVLQVIAKTISDAVQNRGLVCRTGGEEITVFFPGSSIEEAAAVCEEVRIAVEETSVDTKDNDGKAVTLQVTISAGVATNLLGDEGVAQERVQDVVSCADRALYAAKEDGRNRVAQDTPKKGKSKK